MCYICTRNQVLRRLRERDLTVRESKIDPWCNGNTADFGSVVLGSSPSGSTKKPLNYLRGFFVLSRY